jgi:hypothetical protein
MDFQSAECLREIEMKRKSAVGVKRVRGRGAKTAQRCQKVHTDAFGVHADFKFEMCCVGSHAAEGSRWGGARRRSSKAVNRSTRSIGPLHRGHSQDRLVWCSAWDVRSRTGSADASSSSRKQAGRSWERLRVLRKPNPFKRTTPRWTHDGPKFQIRKNFPHADQHSPNRYRQKARKR